MGTMAARVCGLASASDFGLSDAVRCRTSAVAPAPMATANERSDKSAKVSPRFALSAFGRKSKLLCSDNAKNPNTLPSTSVPPAMPVRTQTSVVGSRCVRSSSFGSGVVSVGSAAGNVSSVAINSTVSLSISKSVLV